MALSAAAVTSVAHRGFTRLARPCSSSTRPGWASSAWPVPRRPSTTGSRRLRRPASGSRPPWVAGCSATSSREVPVLVRSESELYAVPAVVGASSSASPQPSTPAAQRSGTAGPSPVSEGRRATHAHGVSLQIRRPVAKASGAEGGRPGTALVSGAGSSSARSSTSVTLPTTSRKGRRTRDAEIMPGSEDRFPRSWPDRHVPGRVQVATQPGGVGGSGRDRPCAAPSTAHTHLDSRRVCDSQRNPDDVGEAYRVVRSDAPLVPHLCAVHEYGDLGIGKAGAELDGELPLSQTLCRHPSSSSRTPGPRDVPRGPGASTQLSEFPRSILWMVDGAFFERASSVAS
ncbi:hypothetical protein Gobs01_02092 [Geodermatophilus obscurus DSM 43160]